jgi:PAS domain S-box-containing protein
MATRSPVPRKSRPDRQAKSKAALSGPPPARSAAQILQELQIHQVELEMQNEELRQAQLALEESRDRYLDLYEFSPVGYLTLDAHGQVAEANLTACKLLAVHRQVLVGRRFDVYIADADRERWHGMVADSMNRREALSVDVALVRGAGGSFHVHIHGQRRGGVDEPPTLRLAVSKNEGGTNPDAELRASEERLRLALDASSDGLWDADLRTGVVYRSARWAETVGARPGEIPPDLDGFKRIVHPDDLDRVMEDIHAHENGKTRSIDSEFRLASRYGETNWIRGRGRVVERDADGAPLRVIGTISDITQRKLSEHALKDSEARFRAIFEHSLDAMLLARPSGAILAANPAAQVLFGYSQQELCKIGREGLVDTADPRLGAALAERERTGRFAGELTYITKAGQRIAVDVTSAVFPGQDGRSMACIMVRDISERKRAEDDARRLQAEMGQMLEWQVARHTAAALAHELNQPLASIAVLCEAVKRMVATGCECKIAEPLSEAVKRMSAESERADAAVRHLLESLQRSHTTSQEISLCEAMHGAARLARAGGAGHCEIILECPADLPTVRVNRLQLEKVFLNLIANSAEAMGSEPRCGGRIWITAECSPGEAAVRLSVRDDGPGINPELQAQIFHPFVTTKARGLGMGLAISRALVEAQGGKLWYEAQDGPGALFRFTLPLAR